MHLAILTRQIGHYHHARYTGAAEAIGKVTVISTANQGGFSQFLSKETGRYNIVKLFEDRNAYDQAVAEKQLARTLMTALDRLSPDVIAISGWANPESIIGIRWALAHGCGLIMMSESQADDAARSIPGEFIKHRIVSLCHAAFVGGPSHAKYISQLGIPSEHVALGYNAVGNDHFSIGADIARANEKIERERLKLPERYILASSRFIEKKNLPGLVEAYAAARTSTDAPDLVILGDGKERPKIEKAITDLGVVDHVHLPGFFGYEDLPALYGLSEGFAHVSTVEQWGLVINEAMASGIPVVASNRCGASRTVMEDRVTGYIVDPYPDHIAEGLRALFALDITERKAMGEAAREAIEAWGPARFGSGLLEAAEIAIARKDNRGPAPWDHLLLRMLETRINERVS